MDIYPGKEDRLVYEAESALQLIKVFDKLNGFRYLTLNGVQHGGNLPGRPERLVLPYFRSAMAALAFLDRPRDYLFIGLGMGAMPAFLGLVQPDADIDVVEIDPAVVGVAEVWFGLTQREGLKVTVGDGRKYVVETGKRYDAVFLDAYQDLGVPTHLTTVEFMREVRGILKPGGVAVSNLWGSVVNPLFENCVSTLAEVFPQLYQFKTYTYNYIFVADTKEEAIMPGELLTRAKKATAKLELGFDLVDLIRRHCTRLDKDSAAAMLLRD